MRSAQWTVASSHAQTRQQSCVRGGGTALTSNGCIAHARLLKPPCDSLAVMPCSRNSNAGSPQPDRPGIRSGRHDAAHKSRAHRVKRRRALVTIEQGGDIRSAVAFLP